MSLNHTIQETRDLLSCIAVDLEKAAGGNKAAAQRVRTGTIKLEKIAKKFRKESIDAEKSGSMKRPAKKSASKPKAAKMKAKPKAKVVHAKHHQVAKRPAGKMPMKKF